ncbi:LamG domain-containing protein [Termitidicoccus mucosus]|uniref:LamG-like jellyroll fold domain-containing protein n=1 Tax=Termitidicoccus mucosus TaxID=1184151 RepID=A0A178IPS1_9BACT|nr:hypothetical protein AW736_01870 [Opitutaceae bacterium TSB47]
MKSRGSCIHVFILAIALPVIMPSTHGQAIRYTFESQYEVERSWWTRNSGTAGTTMLDINSFDLRMHTPGRKDRDLAKAVGVGGRGLALDFTCNVSATEPPAIAIQSKSALDAPITALTLTGWIKNPAPMLKNTTLLRSHTAAKNGGYWLRITGENSLALVLGVGGNNVTTPIDSDRLAVIDKWIFFAVAWDSQTGLVRWYLGDEDGNIIEHVPVRALGTTGRTLMSVPEITLGRGNFTRPGFGGLMDDIRIYDSALNDVGIAKICKEALADD